MNDLEQARANGVAPWDQIVTDLGDFHVTVYQDKYPVTQGHLLFVPNYNTPGVILDAMESAVRHGEKMIMNGQCHAFNVGINRGAAAGQTVMYPHVHMIPRNHGDCADPVGGVRGVIAGQANYKSTLYQQPV